LWNLRKLNTARKLECVRGCLFWMCDGGRPLSLSLTLSLSPSLFLIYTVPSAVSAAYQICQQFFIYDLLIAKSRKSWQNANQATESNTKCAHSADNKSAKFRTQQGTELIDRYVCIYAPYRYRYG